MGETSENRTLKAQLQQVATAVPIERVRVGNTSAASTQLTGPNEREKTIDVKKIIAIPARCAAKFISPEPGGNDATIAASTENVQTKVAAPKSKGLLRPIRSTRSVMKLKDGRK